MCGVYDAVSHLTIAHAQVRNHFAEVFGAEKMVVLNLHDTEHFCGLVGAFFCKSCSSLQAPPAASARAAIRASKRRAVSPQPLPGPNPERSASPLATLSSIPNARPFILARPYLCGHPVRDQRGGGHGGRRGGAQPLVSSGELRLLVF